MLATTKAKEAHSRMPNLGETANSTASIDTDLFILAFDHRSVLRRLFGDGMDLSLMQSMKAVVADALLLVADSVRRETGAHIGLLIDEESGAQEISKVRAEQVFVSTPIERSGASTFTLDHGERFVDRLNAIAPDHAKALVFLNPDDDDYTPQIAAVGAAVRGATEAGHPFMLEIIVPPTAEQLTTVDGDELRFDREIRPELVRRTIEDCYRIDMRPELWKLEGLESAEDYAHVARTIRAIDPLARAIVLGRGADDRRVDHWLRLAAKTDGFAGFAIGRSIWYEGLRAWQADEITRDVAVNRIGAAYARFCTVYHDASVDRPTEGRTAAHAEDIQSVTGAGASSSPEIPASR